MEYRTLEGNVKAIQDVSFNIPLNSSLVWWGIRMWKNLSCYVFVTTTSR
ncbi:MAG: hypothetical protein CM15mP108_2820 [Gammaproteobacteria bacterium]|nr:MAG: hypothetical protein CM15mP108_2820 [Gammaproteobacteria bacterium]